MPAKSYNGQLKNKVIIYLKERRCVELYFTTKFREIFELSRQKDAKILKVRFRN